MTKKRTTLVAIILLNLLTTGAQIRIWYLCRHQPTPPKPTPYLHTLPNCAQPKAQTYQTPNRSPRQSPQLTEN
jgi:hypothetical protein